MVKRENFMLCIFYLKKKKEQDLPGGTVGKNPPANAGNTRMPSLTVTLVNSQLPTVRRPGIKVTSSFSLISCICLVTKSC